MTIRSMLLKGVSEAVHTPVLRVGQRKQAYSAPAVTRSPARKQEDGPDPAPGHSSPGFGAGLIPFVGDIASQRLGSTDTDLGSFFH